MLILFVFVDYVFVDWLCVLCVCVDVFDVFVSLLVIVFYWFDQSGELVDFELFGMLELMYCIYVVCYWMFDLLYLLCCVVGDCVVVMFVF